jgi:isopenicillin-N N-acyltransferase-like protein
MATSFPLIEVSGTSYQIGYQHGEQAAPRIQAYLAWIQKLTGLSRDRLCANAIRFLPGIKALSTELFDEICGLAHGARISMEEALLCQSRAEAAQHWEGGCTAFALRGKATADGKPLLGQNQDLEPEYADVAILLKVRPSDGRPRAVMFTFAGQLGYSGMNQFGVAHFANALYNFRWRPGLPHYPLKRILLEQRTVAQCVDLLRKHRTCSAANVVLGDGQGDIADVEVRPEGIAILEDDNRDQRLHANHYLTSQFARFEDGTLPDSCPRLDRIRELVKENWGRITVDALKSMLSDHNGDPAAICRHGSRKMYSISGYIAEPARGLLHVRRGLGCKGSWQTYEV